MAVIELRGLGQGDVIQLSEQLVRDLKAVGADADWQIEYFTEQQPNEVYRNAADLTAYIPVVVAAVSAGGALTVLLSQEGILAKIAQLFEKRLESKKSELIIRAADGSSIELRSTMTAGEIKSILREVSRREGVSAVSNTASNTNAPSPNP